MELLERSGELAALRDAVADASDHRGSVALLVGEAGIGKSSLLDEFARDPGGEARVLVGWCDDLVTSRTYGPLRDVARKLGGALADSIDAADTAAVTEAVLALLDDPLRPTVLVLEDVHWADEATLDIVRLVGRRIERLRALLVLSYRESDLDLEHPLRGVLAALPFRSVRRLRPRPLSKTAVAELVAGTGLDPADVANLTGGNPFFVSEVAQQGTLPTSVTDAVLARLQTLGSVARRSVELLSVLPRAADRSVVLTLVDDPGALAEAEARGLLVADQDTIGFQHELARRAVHASLPVTTRVRHHDRVLEYLLANDGDPPAILHHAVGAGRAEVVATYGPVAVAQAYDAGANREAAANAEVVLRYDHLLEDEAHAMVLQQRSWALYNLGRFPEAQEAAEGALELRTRIGPPEAHGRTVIAAARMAYMANDPGRAQELLALEERLGLELEDREVTAMMAVNRAGLSYLLGHVDDALVAAEAAATLLAELDRPDLSALVAVYRGCARLACGELAGLEELRAALGTDVSPATAEPIARAYTNLVTWLVELRRWEEVEETVAEATEFFADHDLQAHHINTLGTVAWMHLLRGDWEAAEELMDALDEGEEGVLQVGSLAARALIAVRRGDDDAENRIHTAWDLALGSQSPWLLLPTAAAAVEFAWTKSDRSIATPFLERTNDVRSNRSRDWVDWRLHVLFDEQADPKQLYHATERASVAEGWRAGAEMWSSDGMPYEQALELIRSAEVDATLDGLAILDRLGAEPAATIARHRLRELGVKSIPRGPQASTRENPMGLTDRQVDVLQLLVEGLTNAEIAEQLVVSVRTVDHHVSAILQKLRVDSRQEAVEVAASFGAS